jgi:3-deoxy-manno-octulosonate cytidylyltransferase (CMP-KDO synthetase)
LSRAVTPLIAIPVRLAATRLPNKPLADLNGTPLVIHVWRRAIAAGIARVIVACGDREIAEVVTKAGGEAVMTDPSLPSGSDRVAAAADIVDPGGRYDVVVNLQGDVPDPARDELAAVLSPLADPAVDIATVATAMGEAARGDPNSVKIALAIRPGSRIGRALYFSRAPIPSGAGPLYHHFGLYAFRRDALHRFVALPQGVLEARERLEQLRALEAGMRIDVALIDRVLYEINTPEDLARDRARLAAQQG